MLDKSILKIIFEFCHNIENFNLCIILSINFYSIQRNNFRLIYCN